MRITHASPQRAVHTVILVAITSSDVDAELLHPPQPGSGAGKILSRPPAAPQTAGGVIVGRGCPLGPMQGVPGSSLGVLFEKEHVRHPTHR